MTHHQEAEALNRQGEEQYRSGDARSARMAFEQALALDPRFIAARNNLGRLLWETGDIQRAREQFSTVLQTAPNNGEAVDGLGDILIALGEFDRAEKLFANYLRAFPDNSGIARKFKNLIAGFETKMPFPEQQWRETPNTVRAYVEKTLMAQRREAETKRALIYQLKQRYFPNATFVGPYEKAGVVHGVFTEQWLWQYRHWVRGDVMDMSTPRYWSRYLSELPGVTKWLVSDLCETVIEKMGHSSPVDVVGDFCASPPPCDPESLDTILSISILEHCTNPFAMVRNLASILKPRGVVFFQMPFAYIDGHLRPDYWRFCRDGYLLLAKEAGLDVLAIGEYGDLGRYLFNEYGISAEKNGQHHGIPLINWMICRKPG